MGTRILGILLLIAAGAMLGYAVGIGETRLGVVGAVTGVIASVMLAAVGLQGTRIIHRVVTPDDAGGRIISTEEAMSTQLRRCCKRNTPATVIVADSGIISQARFVSLGERSVTLDLFDYQGGFVDVLATICVAYYVRGRGCTFVATVEEFIPAGNDPIPRVRVRRPNCIATTERRRTLRVPIFPGAGLKVKMTSGAKSVEVKPHDASLAGLKVEVSSEIKFPQLKVDEQVQVEVVYRDLRVQTTATIRNVSQGRYYGLYFPDFVRGEEIVAPDAYRQILLGLEKAWATSMGITQADG
ncbi:MAG: hypothetical protein H6707_01295 [Deltaproteobacteria bacterium]|nr:hypothetical protein [Deltaproteobacteria bacterium]